MTRVTDARVFGAVALVSGGDSAEREVSLAGAAAVHEALTRRGVTITQYDGVSQLLEAIAAGRVDRVFNLLHGRGGEDGALQGALRCLGVPVTGSGILGSALSMDKARTKRLWMALGLPTAPFVEGQQSMGEAVRDLGFPLVVKPVREGSSFGIHLVTDESALQAAVADAAQYDEVMFERLLPGPEYTVGILQGQPLPTIRIETAGTFYDYDAKYVSDETQYHIPAGLSAAEEEDLAALAVRAFAAVGCSGWGRVDLMRDTAGGFALLEVNTTPGMTNHSLVPKAAAAAGISFDDLVWRILETSL